MSFSSVGMSGPAGVTRGGEGEGRIEVGRRTIEQGMIVRGGVQGCVCGVV